jgi:hypothetical protein
MVHAMREAAEEEPMEEIDCCASDGGTPLLERTRAYLGLAPLPREGRLKIEAAIAMQTPSGMRLEDLLALGEELGALMNVMADDVDAWGGSYRRLDALGYAVRLVEAQIIAGNTGPGIMLPDPDLTVP